MLADKSSGEETTQPMAAAEKARTYRCSLSLPLPEFQQKPLQLQPASLPSILTPNSPLPDHSSHPHPRVLSLSLLLQTPVSIPPCLVCVSGCLCVCLLFSPRMPSFYSSMCISCRAEGNFGGGLMRDVEPANRQLEQMRRAAPDWG